MKKTIGLILLIFVGGIFVKKAECEQVVLDGRSNDVGEVKVVHSESKSLLKNEVFLCFAIANSLIASFCGLYFAAENRRLRKLQACGKNDLIALKIENGFRKRKIKAYEHTMLQHQHLFFLLTKNFRIDDAIKRIRPKNSK